MIHWQRNVSWPSFLVEVGCGSLAASLNRSINISFRFEIVTFLMASVLHLVWLVVFFLSGRLHTSVYLHWVESAVNKASLMLTDVQPCSWTLWLASLRCLGCSCFWLEPFVNAAGLSAVGASHVRVRRRSNVSQGLLKSPAAPSMKTDLNVSLQSLSLIPLARKCLVHRFLFCYL